MTQSTDNTHQDTEEETITNKMAAWRANHPHATLTEIENQIDGELARLRQRLVQDAVVDATTGEAVECPQCGEAMVNNGKKERRLQIKGGETVHFSRQQKRCRHCGTTLFPPR